VRRAHRDLDAEIAALEEQRARDVLTIRARRRRSSSSRTASASWRTASCRTSSRDPLVGIVMGSQSDWPTMRAAADVLGELEIAHEARVVSAHRTPDRLWAYGRRPRRGACASSSRRGGGRAPAGMMASKTALPVIGVPVETRALGGLDSLLSIVQMPRGFPVATMGIGGAANAGLMAAAILRSRTRHWPAARGLARGAGRVGPGGPG
jgi:5-(carboxyamino)imidazole ribonucleotide mutase